MAVEFGIEVEFLLGKFFARDVRRPDLPEWPPHPARLFSGLVAGAHEAPSLDGDEARGVLRWLEELPPPTLGGPGVVEGAPSRNGRQRVSHSQFKPAPDDIDTSSGTVDDPHKNVENPYTPCVPVRGPIEFGWQCSEAEWKHFGDVLGRLVEALPRLGSAKSSVRASTNESLHYQPHFIPTDEENALVETRLRWVPAGFLEQLRERYETDGHTRFTKSNRWIGYRRGDLDKPDIDHGSTRMTDGTLIRFVRAEGPRVNVSRTYQASQTLRAALMAHADDPPPPTLSGHAGDDGQLKRDHISVFPAPFAGSEYADGQMMGLFLWIPSDAPEDERSEIVDAVDSFTSQEGTNFHFPDSTVWRLERPAVSESVPISVSTWPYVEASRTWATVTPILLPRWPDDRPGNSIPEIVHDTFRHIDAPDPELVELFKDPVLQGVPHVDDFKLPDDKQIGDRLRRHAVVHFEEPVRGPIVLGSGRYRGFGLLRGVPSDSD